MAETPNEEPVDKENVESEARTPEEIIVPNEQETKQIADLESEAVNPIPPTETMEVHHHAHIHSKSKWKEYFFQFFYNALGATRIVHFKKYAEANAQLMQVLREEFHLE